MHSLRYSRQPLSRVLGLRPITASLKGRIIAAVALALPLALIITGYADHSGWKPDGLGMCLLAPGMALVLKGVVPYGHPNHLVDAIAEAGLTALVYNWAYYTGVSYGVLAIRSGLRRKA